MIFSSDILSPLCVCPNCDDKCKVTFVKSQKLTDNPYFATECGLCVQRSWNLLTTIMDKKNCNLQASDYSQVNFFLDTLSKASYKGGESQCFQNNVIMMLGLKEEAWDISKQQLFTIYFNIEKDFKDLITSIIQNRPFDRLMYIEETEDTAEAFLWLAKQEFPKNENNMKYFFPIDVSFWIFSICGDVITSFEELEYLKLIKEKNTAPDPVDQLRNLVSFAEEAAEEGSMKQNTYNEICLWAKTSMSGFKRKR